jgi:hypothetical protein
MTNVQPKLTPRQELDRRRGAAAVGASTAVAVAAGLEVKPCHLCAAPVVWCTTSGRFKRGPKPVAVEVVAEGDGRVAIEPSLIFCAGQAPCAYEIEAATRYRWHDCPGAISHVAGARARKVRT